MKFFGELGFLEANKTNQDSSTESAVNPAPERIEDTPIGLDIVENLGESLPPGGIEEALAAAEGRPAPVEEGAAPAEERTAPADQQYAAAVRCYLRGELDEALEKLRSVQAEGKDLGEVYTAMAQIYLDCKATLDLRHCDI